MPITHTTPPISPLPGQEDQSARLAASAEVDQVGDARPDSGLLHAAKRIDRYFKHPEECTCITCDCPSDYTHRFVEAPTLQDFHAHLLNQRESLSLIPAMAEKVLAIDCALHELDLYSGCKPGNRA